MSELLRPKRDVRRPITDASSAPPESDGVDGIVEASERLRQLIENSPFGMYVVDADFRIAHMNARSQAGAFRNVVPVIGRDFSEAMRILWPEPVAQEILGRFRHTLDTGESFRSERFTRPRRDVGGEESYEWELHRLRLPDGRHGVACYYYDSTELREAEAAASESEARLRAFIEASSDVVYRMTPDWTQMRLPSGRASVPDPLEPTQRWLEDFIHPQDRTAVLQAIGQAIDTGRKFEIEHRVQRADGTLAWMHSRAIPVLDEHGEIVEWFGTASDVTTRREAEEQLRERARIETLLADVGELASRDLDFASLVHAVGKRVAAELAVSRCGFARVDVARGEITVVSDYHGALPSLAGTYAIEQYASSYLDDALSGRSAVFADLATDPRTSAVYEAAFAPIRVRAHVTVPLHQDGRWLAGFWVAHHEPRDWTANEVKAIERIAERAWAVIERRRMDQELRDSEAAAVAALSELEVVYEARPSDCASSTPSCASYGSTASSPTSTACLRRRTSAAPSSTSCRRSPARWSRSRGGSSKPGSRCATSS